MTLRRQIDEADKKKRTLEGSACFTKRLPGLACHTSRQLQQSFINVAAH